MRRALALLAALGASLSVAGAAPAATAPAGAARLAYLVGIDGDSPVVWGANADGSGRVRLAVGASDAKISPDGSMVAIAEQDASGSGTSLVVAPSGGPTGTPPPARRLLRTNDLILLAWSADGGELAVEADDRLVVVDVASGVKHVIASGFIDGASFSPSGRQLVYGRGITTVALISSLVSAPCSNLFVANADGSGRRALTHDGLAANPLWGPRRIAFSRARKCFPVGGGPAFPAQLWLMRPDGHGLRQLTHVRFGPGSTGLSPTAWSDDGRRLLAEQDTPSDTGFVAPADGAWTVELPSGRARQLRVRGRWVVGDALSHDGGTVLATLVAGAGIFPPPATPPRQAIVTIPWRGGRPHVLARDAGSPSWNR